MGQQKRSKVGLEQPLLTGGTHKNQQQHQQNNNNNNKNKNYPKGSTVQSSTFTVVLFYCVLIIVSPIATFFTSKYFLFDSWFGLTAIQSNIWSAALAIIALHLALGLYLYRAYFEGEVTTIKTTRRDANRKLD